MEDILTSPLSRTDHYQVILRLEGAPNFRGRWGGGGGLIRRPALGDLWIPRDSGMLCMASGSAEELVSLWNLEARRALDRIVPEHWFTEDLQSMKRRGRQLERH